MFINSCKVQPNNNMVQPKLTATNNFINNTINKQDNLCPASWSCVSNIAFAGITKRMKHHTYIDGQKDIDEFVSKRSPKQTLYTGQLPDLIYRNIKDENKKDAILDIYKGFDDAVADIRDFRDAEDMSQYSVKEIMNNCPEYANQRINDVLHKHNIIKPHDEVELEYLDKGGKGSVYKINGLRDSKNDDEYVMKIYHVVKGEDWQPFKSHGNYAETNSAASWTHSEGQYTQRGKFFWGNLKEGYIVCNFIDDDIRLPKKNVDEYSKGLKCTDESKTMDGYNRKKGYNYDWGGVRVVNRIKNENKVAMYVLKRIKNTPKDERVAEWFKIYHTRDHIDQQGKNAGLALSIKHMKNKEYYIDKCLEMNDPVVNRAICYNLKYLPHEQAVKYFTKLAKTDDDITQVILFNEIPLLAREQRDGDTRDDLNTSREKIDTNKIETYYKIAEEYARPNAIEHLASFVHLLPEDKIAENYEKLLDIDNYNLQDRLIYKMTGMPTELQKLGVSKLQSKVTNKRLLKKLSFWVD